MRLEYSVTCAIPTTAAEKVRFSVKKIAGLNPKPGASVVAAVEITIQEAKTCPGKGNVDIVITVTQKKPNRAEAVKVARAAAELNFVNMLQAANYICPDECIASWANGQPVYEDDPADSNALPIPMLPGPRNLADQKAGRRAQDAAPTHVKSKAGNGQTVWTIQWSLVYSCDPPSFTVGHPLKEQGERLPRPMPWPDPDPDPDAETDFWGPLIRQADAGRAFAGRRDLGGRRSVPAPRPNGPAG